MTLQEFFDYEKRYQDYTIYMRKLDKIIQNLPMGAQIFRYYEKLTYDKMVTNGEYHAPYKNGLVQLDNQSTEQQGIHLNSSFLGKIQKDYDNELLKVLGQEKHDYFNQTLLEWNEKGKRNSSKNVLMLKNSIHKYLEEFSSDEIYVKEELTEQENIILSSKEIKIILDLQDQYLDKVYKKLFYDEEDTFNDSFVIMRGLNVSEDKLFLEPHYEKNYLSSYTANLDVAIGLAVKGYDNKIIIFDKLENCHNRIIASSFINPVLNSFSEQNELLIIPNTNARKMKKVSNVEDLSLYQVYNDKTELLTSDFYNTENSDEPIFPSSEIQEAKEYINNIVKQGSIFPLDYNKVRYCITFSSNKYKVQLINDIYETFFIEYDSLNELFNDKELFNGKTLIEIFDIIY